MFYQVVFPGALRVPEVYRQDVHLVFDFTTNNVNNEQRDASGESAGGDTNV